MQDQLSGLQGKGDVRGLSVSGQLTADEAETAELPGGPVFAEVLNRDDTSEIWICMDPNDEAEVEGSNSTCVLPLSAVTVSFIVWSGNDTGEISLISEGTPKYTVQEIS